MLIWAGLFSSGLVSPAFLFILKQPDPANSLPFTAHNYKSNRKMNSNYNPESNPVEIGVKVLNKLLGLNQFRYVLKCSSCLLLVPWFPLLSVSVSFSIYFTFSLFIFLAVSFPDYCLLLYLFTFNLLYLFCLAVTSPLRTNVCHSFLC